jgi:UDP-N-acetylmuramyl tripeptide synthase
MQLADLIQRLTAVSIHGPLDREITAVRYDSRRVAPGNLFVAVRGACFDGHSFIEQAVDKGASAVVGEQPGLSQRATTIVVPDSREALARLAATFYGDPSRKLKVIGVTGTNGKSTTTFLIKHLLERANQATGLIGTVQYEVGQRVLPAQRTTPESLDLQELLSQCVEAGCRNVVIEVSSHALSQGRAKEIAFDVGAFTNLTQDHLDFHQGMKSYFEAKAHLFESLRDNPKKEKVAVINIDDLVGRLDGVEKRLAAMLQAAQIMRNPLANFYNSLTDEQRQRFDALGAPTNRRSRRIQMVGPASAKALAEVCSQGTESFVQQRSLERIEQTVRPTEQQKSAFNALKEASSEAAKKLQAAPCPTETPQTPMDRLDAVEKRLDAMVQAVKTVRTPLDNFYVSLSDEQKARFNIMGAVQNSRDR